MITQALQDRTGVTSAQLLSQATALALLANKVRDDLSYTCSSMLNRHPRTTQYSSAAACRFLAPDSQSVAPTAQERPRRAAPLQVLDVGQHYRVDRPRDVERRINRKVAPNGMPIERVGRNNQRADRPLPVGTGAAAYGSPAPTPEPQVVMKVHQNGRVEVTGPGTATDVAPSPSCRVCRQKSCVCDFC
jgi:hypothetical protein